MHTRSVSRSLIKIIIFCLSAIILPGTFRLAHAGQQANVILKAEAGFDGYAKEGSWIPVHITVENKGNDINEASIHVSYKDFNNIASIFGAELSLPSNSRKELFVYVYYPQSGAANLDVELISAKKTITKTSVRVSNVTPQSLVIGLLTNTPSTFSGLSQVTPQNGITRLVELDPANLPDKSQGWETLDAIIVSDFDTGVLSETQRKAMELWIARGGILFTVGGPKWQSTVQGLQELLPIQVTGTTTVTAAADIGNFYSALNFAGSNVFPEETESILATGKISKNADVLAVQGEIPLVIEKKLGKGKSIFFAADPSLAPYKNWSGTFFIYDSLLNFKHPQAAWVNGKWDIPSTNEAITTIAELSIPSILIICGLMIVYIGLIGPVNYIFLRLINKREWAWITIPAIVVFVTTISYVYGYFYRGTTPTLNRLTVIQAWDGVSQAEKDTLIGIYSPQRKTYTLESEDGALLYPYNLEDVNLNSTTAWRSSQTGQNTNVPEIPIEIGGMKVIGSSGTTIPLQIEHDLTISFVNGSARITGTITNNSKVTLTKLSLITPAKWKALGNLAPGKSVKVDLPISTTTNSPEYFFDGSLSILQTTPPQLQLNEVLRRKEAFLRSVITVEPGENNSNWGIYLAGWLDEPQPSATLANLKTKNTDATLYIDQISPLVSRASQKFTLTTALFEWQSSTNDTSPYYAYSYNNSEFTLHFRPAIPVNFSGVKQLQLNLDSYSLSTAIEVSLWNFKLNGWEVMKNVNWLYYNVTDPENYVSPAGEVILHIKDGQNLGYIEMKKSNITLVVTP